MGQRPSRTRCAFTLAATAGMLLASMTVAAAAPASALIVAEPASKLQTAESESAAARFEPTGRSVVGSGQSETPPPQTEPKKLVIPPAPPPPPGPATETAKEGNQPTAGERTRPSGDVLIPEGTVIEIRMAQRLSSESNRQGDRFDAILDRSIENEAGQVIIPKGTTLRGRIVAVKEPGRVKGRASMTFQLDAIEMRRHDEQGIKTNEITIEAESGVGDDAKQVGIGAAIGAGLGAIFGGRRGAVVGGATGAGSSTGRVLLTKGKQVVIDRERLFSFRLEEDLFVSLDE